MKAQIEPLGERSQILYLGLPQFFITILSASFRLTHSRYRNAIILCDKMASSLRWTVFETFVPAALAHRRRLRGMMEVHPLPAPSVSTPTRLPCRNHVPRKGCGKPYQEEQQIRRRALQNQGARLSHAHSESITLPF